MPPLFLLPCSQVGRGGGHRVTRSPARCHPHWGRQASQEAELRCGFQIDPQGLPSPTNLLAYRHIHPAFAEFVRVYIRALLAVDANADVALKHGGDMVRVRMSIRASSKLGQGRSETEVFHKRIKIPVAEQQGNIRFDAPRCNQSIYRLSNCHAAFT